MAEDEDVFMETPTGSPQSHPSSADLDLQTAVAVSMDELDCLGQVDNLGGIDEGHFDNQPCHGASSTVNSGTEKPQPNAAAQKTIEDQLRVFQEAAQYALDKRIELPLLNFADADTLVIIDPPPVTRKGGQGGGGCGLISPDSAPHRMHSERLKATGSAYFIDALGPTKQYRLVRRRRLLPLPPGIKFVIDLTPPEEGDMAVELTTELSCSKGVRQYFHAEQRFEIREGLVGGHDDLEEKNIISNARHPTPVPEAGGNRIPMDYTAIRHRSAIERVLHIIEGLDPRIDSAPKMWSVFCVAKFLNCTSVVENYILSWIYDGLNVRFIEILPEVTLKIAEGLRNQMLCRDAFSVLVGEEALASVGRDVSGGLWKSRARRRREELDLDSFVTRVEYASKAFAERVNATFTGLAEAEWITEIPQYQKIVSSLETRLGGSCTAIDTLTTCLRNFVRTRISYALSKLPSLSGDLDGSALPENRKGKESFPYLSHAEVYGGITHKEALLVRDYWGQLASWDLFAQNFTPHAIPLVWVSGIDDNFQKATWDDVIKETERFNWLVIEMTAKDNTSLRAPSLGDSKGTPSSRTGPPQVVSSEAPGSGCSAEVDIVSNSRLPIRPKHDQGGSAPEVPGSRAAEALPIRPRPYPQGVTPSELLFNAGPSKSSPVRLKGDSPRQFRIRELFKGTVDPRDISIVQPRHDSDEVLKKANTLTDPGFPLPTRQMAAAECENVVVAGSVGAGPPEGQQNLKGPGGITQWETTGVKVDHEDVVNDSCPICEECHHLSAYHPFNVYNFLKECGDRMYDLSKRMTKGSVSFDALITDTLLSLEDNEWKYLPLYAGGNDDGSGGVFDEPIPNAVTGPIGPGPRYHIGLGSAASSEFDMIDAKSTVSSSFDTSMGVEDGYSDHLDRRIVYSDDGMDGHDIKGKGKAREVDEKGDGEEDEDATLAAHDSDNDDGDFCEVEDDLMLFT
jgi:hypothetical protein